MSVFLAARQRFALVAILVILCISTPSIWAQVEQGRFVGKITDPSGAAIPAAEVVARNVDTNILYKAVSNGTGDYVITSVPSGNYVLTVNASGFQQAATQQIELQVGQIARQDVPLSIGTSTTVVNVNTAAPLLSTDTPTMNEV